MPRKSRIDAAGSLHHVIARGIAKNRIFYDDHDRDWFLERLGAIVKESDTSCLAWALIPNHFHLLIKTGEIPLSTLMRRLLTGYAVSFNRRHKRVGHLFQNRYKSILCQQDAYLLELTRYIHLNPLRAGLVEDLRSLERYPYCGHGVVLGRQKNDWQSTEPVLSLFGNNQAEARKEYRTFVQKGVEQGQRPELTGGGLVRSTGGWSALKSLRNEKGYIKGDERILGDSDFVAGALKQADEYLDRKYSAQIRGLDLNAIRDRVAAELNIDAGLVFAAGKNRHIVQARSLACYWAVRECGMTMAFLSRKMGVSITAVSKSVARGEKIAKKEKHEL